MACNVTHLWTDEIEGILPREESHGQLVVVRHVDSPGSVFVLDAATGRIVWTTPAPAPRHEGHNVQVEPEEMTLLSGTTADHPPRLFFQRQFVSCVREAAFVTDPTLARFPVAGPCAKLACRRGWPGGPTIRGC